MSSESNVTVQDGHVVELNYTLTDTSGEVIDSTEGSTPLTYLHGVGQIVPGLENRLRGCKVGEKVSVDVSPEDGYGERDGQSPQPVSKDVLPEGMEVEVGMILVAEGPDGEVLPVWVTKIEDDHIFLDGNHPLAGKSLHFDVEILGIRDATPEELEHGHAHGPEGHHH